MRYGIALGSNVGDRLQFLRKAVKAMQSAPLKAAIAAAAPVYETTPVDCPEGSGNFLNTVVELECEAGPHVLLDALRQIENDLGRPADHVHHAPRTIDLDVLYAGELVLRDERLHIPHPRIRSREFVLRPLADIRPDLVLPGEKVSVARLLSSLTPAGSDLRLRAVDWL